MSIVIKIKPEDLPKPRSFVTVAAMARKGGRMKPKGQKKPKENRRAWKKDVDSGS